MINPEAIITKYPAAKRFIGFRLPWLATGETIDSATAVVDDDGLTLNGDAQIDENEIAQFIEDGVAGTDYIVTFHYVTSLGEEDDLNYLVKVVASGQPEAEPEEPEE